MNDSNKSPHDVVLFNEAYHELIETTGDINKVRQIAQKALGLARTIGHSYLEINVLCATANNYLSGGQLKTALKIYDEAVLIAQQAQSKAIAHKSISDRDLYEQLEIQTLFYKGTALLKNPPQYNEVFEVFQKVEYQLNKILAEKENAKNADWMNGGMLHFYRFEAFRLSGFCQEQLEKSQSALQFYAKAISTAEKMTIETRKGTSLIIVGKAMLNICRKASMKEAYFKVIDKLNALIGVDWEKEKEVTKK